MENAVNLRPVVINCKRLVVANEIVPVNWKNIMAITGGFVLPETGFLTPRVSLVPGDTKHDGIENGPQVALIAPGQLAGKIEPGAGVIGPFLGQGVPRPAKHEIAKVGRVEWSQVAILVNTGQTRGGVEIRRIEVAIHTLPLRQGIPTEPVIRGQLGANLVVVALGVLLGIADIPVDVPQITGPVNIQTTNMDVLVAWDITVLGIDPLVTARTFERLGYQVTNGWRCAVEILVVIINDQGGDIPLVTAGCLIRRRYKPAQGLVVLLMPIGPVKIDIPGVFLPLQTGRVCLPGPVEITGRVACRVLHADTGIFTVWTHILHGVIHRIKLVFGHGHAIYQSPWV